MTLEEINNLFVKCTFIHKRITTPCWGFNYTKIPHNNLVLVYDGNGIFESRGKRISVKKGDLVFFSIGDNQKMETNKDSLLKLYTVNFLCKTIDTNSYVLNVYDAPLSLPFVTHIQTEEVLHRLISLFDKLHRIHISALGTYEAEERALFAQILAFASYCGNPKISLNYRTKSKIDQTLSYMVEHFKEPLTLHELALYSGLSQSHFSAMFKKVVGTSPIDYLIKLRIDYAKRLLEDGKSVTQASAESGFSDIYYFSNLFKKLSGQSPTQYIRSIRLSLRPF